MIMLALLCIIYVIMLLVIVYNQQHSMSKEFEDIKKKEGGGGWNKSDMKGLEIGKEISFLLTNPEKSENEYFHFLMFRAPGSL